MSNENAIERLSRLFSLLSESNRLRILFFLGKDQRSVSEIIAETGLPQPLVSFHLRILRENRLVTAQRTGTFVHYAISDSMLHDLLTALSGFKTDGKNSRQKKNDFPPWPQMRFMRDWCKGVE